MSERGERRERDGMSERGERRERERREREEQYQFWVPVRPPPQLSPGQCSSAPHCTTMSLPAQHCLHTPRGREGGESEEGEREGGRRGREGGRREGGREEREGGRREGGREKGGRREGGGREEGRRKEEGGGRREEGGRREGGGRREEGGGRREEGGGRREEGGGRREGGGKEEGGWKKDREEGGGNPPYQTQVSIACGLLASFPNIKDFPNMPGDEAREGVIPRPGVKLVLCH